MNKKQISARLPEKLVDYVDEVSENRTNFLAKAVLRMMDEEEHIQHEIESTKQERDELIEKKHKIEKQIEAKRDEVRRLEQLKTEAKTLKKVKNKIPTKEIHSVRQTVRENKYDSDPRAADPNQVIEHNAQRFAEEYSVEKEKVVRILRLHTEV